MEKTDEYTRHSMAMRLYDLGFKRRAADAMETRVRQVAGRGAAFLPGGLSAAHAATNNQQ